MTLFFAMLPIYLLGNLHCLGMCGPLVLMLGEHRHRHLYFLGRALSFSFAGFLAGALGAVIDIYLSRYHIPALTSFLFGGMIFYGGLCQLGVARFPGGNWMGRRLSRVSHTLSTLLLQDRPFATFLFGFFTVLLPCGQTVIVFSACALTGEMLAGWGNGLAFAILTSPSLYFAMHARTWVAKFKGKDQVILGVCALIVGIVAVVRGLADWGVVSHLVLSDEYHIVVF